MPKDKQRARIIQVCEPENDPGFRQRFDSVRGTMPASGWIINLINWRCRLEGLRSQFARLQKPGESYEDCISRLALERVLEGGASE